MTFLKIISGAIGGFLAYFLGNGKFKPVSDVIAHDMKPEDRQQLVRSVERIIADLDAADAIHLLVSIFFLIFKHELLTQIASYS